MKKSLIISSFDICGLFFYVSCFSRRTSSNGECGGKTFYAAVCRLPPAGWKYYQPSKNPV